LAVAALMGRTGLHQLRQPDSLVEKKRRDLALYFMEEEQ
jgi:hypothetical protein